MKTVYLILIVSLLSCEREPNSFYKLPLAKCSSEISQWSSYQEIKIIQINEDSISIEIDSLNFVRHFNQSFYLEVNRAIDLKFFRTYASLKIDSTCSYNQISRILKELGTAGVRKIKFHSNSGFYKYTQMPYYQEIEGKDSSIIIRPPLPPPPPSIEGWSKNRTALYINVNHDSINIVDWNTRNKLDVYNVLRNEKEVLFVYEVDSTCNYQDFLKIYDIVYCPIYSLREEYRLNNPEATKREIIKEYPVNLLNLKHPLTAATRQIGCSL